jgi:hypothetical protein
LWRWCGDGVTRTSDCLPIGSCMHSEHIDEAGCQ